MIAIPIELCFLLTATQHVAYPEPEHIEWKSQSSQARSDSWKTWPSSTGSGRGQTSPLSGTPPPQQSLHVLWRIEDRIFVRHPEEVHQQKLRLVVCYFLPCIFEEISFFKVWLYFCDREMQAVFVVNVLFLLSSFFTVIWF